MFRACIPKVPTPSFSTNLFFHSSAVAFAASTRLTPKAKRALKDKRWRKEQAMKSHVVLGLRADEEARWDECLLAKILVKDSDLTRPQLPKTLLPEVGPIEVPEHLAFGISEDQTKQLLFHLPELSALADFRKLDKNDGEFAEKGSLATEAEHQKAQVFARLLDLRNADAGGVAYENRRRIVETFSGPGNPSDTGRTEVQVALLTYQIRNLWAHLTSHRKDVSNLRRLQGMVHQRAKLLKYFRRTQRARYDILLGQLALNPDSVRGELLVGKI